MTTPRDDDPQHWQQPSWNGPDQVGMGEPPLIEPLPPQTGVVLVPATPARPPSVMESTLNVVAAVAWPLAIVLAIMGTGGWLLNLGAAFVISAAAGAISGELRKRRGNQ
ncbi:MAG: hypothetical protein LWW77_07980 [Propionibacteriales bacterium]|nr:hypothetical protein [Propionibacteriales bacterium]